MTTPNISNLDLMTSDMLPEHPMSIDNYNGISGFLDRKRYKYK
jgi:hypothetical protein